ncbi:MAG: argJ [Defluviitaleaceae bacterium]|jgi:glutamate N-acetyltransferase/amino-acid N-acetyltransferase|uniref:Arginine biosynthesis bifunctional protein ArgJ n=1 Tax=Defluviitalea raffinosedens TaxID=1450156 RepID=A0A7C8HJU5_9FIRM|nr:bifunctional ornithine acetyltransferase/N-acetylglutamate synthase [Defluviitalea raffinosedens]KAE9637331.1 bifunctional ornithine acetyltransferase/N-acetylglutamate synthase [Defluviitalea raffinosedens]MBZ4669674.1 argJ [Defluviitaleaceae bacterium]
MKIIDGGITSPKGFKAAGNYIGIKKKRKDLAIVYSEFPAKAAATFTTNVVKAAPVLWNQQIINEKGNIQAIVVNSGNANACTGEQGMIDAQQMAQTMADCLGLKKEEVLVASTGVIGVPLPMNVICPGIEKTALKLSVSREAAKEAAQAIMTTDTFSKEIAVTFELDGKMITIGGMAKGSGMIHPNMATMLSFITTDINISRELLDKALKESIVDSYNMISVDGDTSTNDMVVALANGAAENVLIDTENEDYEQFKTAFHFVNTYLAQQIVRDGEGAGKFIEVNVKGAKSKCDARTLAKSIITSNLVKTAFFGEDANWGRILCAMGYSGVTFDTSKVTIQFASQSGNITVMKNGTPLMFDEDYAYQILHEKDIKVIALLEEGSEEATAWGCDLSYEYVRINGEYRT